MIKKLYYIAIPYTAGTKFRAIWNMREVASAAYAQSLIVNDDVIAYSPVTYGKALADRFELPHEFDFWCDFAETFLSKCDKLIIMGLDGWKGSRGLLEEADIAFAHKIPVELHRFEGLHYSAPSETISVSSKEELMKL